MIKYEDFAKLDIRVAEIKKAEKVEGSDKLVRLEIDLGDEERQIVAGIAGDYEAEYLEGTQIIVLTNLESRKLMGLESKGMLLAASDDSSGGESIALLKPDKKVKLGSKIN
jgi:methionine--tRNA ligase beta chain